MTVSQEDLRKILDMSRLDVKDDEINSLSEHLNSVIEYFSKLQDLDLPDQDPLIQEGVQAMRFRKDEVVPWTDRDSILDQSPSRDGDFIKVPKIGGDK